MSGVDLGSVPNWLEAGGVAAGVFFQVIGKVRQRQAATWPQMVLAVSNLSAADIQQVLESHPNIAELVASAWEMAASTQGEQKRELLARVAAVAIGASEHDDDLESLTFLMRTVDSLEPPHIRLLTLVGLPPIDSTEYRGTSLEGCLSADDIYRIWPQAGRYAQVMIAHLAREGLIEDRASPAIITDSGAWGISEYGRMFLEFLLEPTGELQGAQLCVWLDRARDSHRGGLRLNVRNQGPTDADDIVAWPSGIKKGIPLYSLAPDEDFLTDLAEGALKGGPPYKIRLTWTDSTGSKERVVSLEP